MARALKKKTAERAAAFDWKLIVQAALIVALGVWAYLPAINGGFLGDDSLYLLNNHLLEDPYRLWKAWFVPGSFVEYYPLHQTVQWFEWKLFGTDTTGYHVVNLLLHLTSCLLFWRLLAKFGLRLAWLGGLIFAVHPLTVESVAQINELKNALSLPFFLLALGAWIDFEAQRRPRDYQLSLLFFLLAMFSKITMSTFPFVILLYAWWKRGRIGWNDVKVALPFFGIALILGLVTIHAGVVYAVDQHHPPEEGVHPALLSRLALGASTLAFYFAHVFVPIVPLPVYPQWRVSPVTLLDFWPWPLFAVAIGWLC